LSLAAAVLFAGPAFAHDGERLYTQRCLACHSHDEICQKLDCLGDDEAVRKRLARLLPVHHTAEDEERAAITAYLLELRRSRRKP
jgi:mono/diheme cytochrome c family protein